MIKNTVLAEFVPIEERVKLQVPYDRLGQAIERYVQRLEQFGVGVVEAYLPMLVVGDKFTDNQMWIDSPLTMLVASGLVADGVCRAFTGNGIVAELEYLSKKGIDYFRNLYNPRK